MEKSTTAFSCHIQFLDLEKAMIWSFSRLKSSDEQPVYLNLFSKYVLFHLAFHALRYTIIFNVDQKLKCVTSKSVY